ncbi:MAG: hypothetical protein HY651_13675 [Acidobacteria bacterium]|nr:hypothetical protein [Acidobacteriota bacterium]
MTETGKVAWSRLAFGGFLTVAAGLCSAPLDLPAGPWQENSGATAIVLLEEVPRVSLAELTGSQGEDVMMPLYFTPDPKVPLRSLTVEIDYVSNNLKFDGASKGLAAENTGVQVSAAVDNGKPDDKGLSRAKLRVTTSLADPANQDGLPEGMLAYLIFRVSNDAKPFAIKLNTSLVSAEDLQNRKVTKVSAQPGLITVETFEAIPTPTCFFFTH